MPYLIYAAETSEERVYELKSGVINTIGRHLDNAIVLRDESVSRYHAEISISADGNTITLKDCQSLNHTFVNEVQIDNCQLHDRDLVYFGETMFKFVDKLPENKSSYINNNAELAEDNLKEIHIYQSQIELQKLVTDTPNDKSILKLQYGKPEQETVNKLKILLEVSKQLCSPDEPEKIASKLLDLLFQIMAIDRGVIFLVNEESEALELKAYKLKKGITATEKLYSNKIVDLAYKTGDAIITNNPKYDERLDNSLSVIRQAIENSICIPLKTYTSIIGVLYVDNLSPLVNYTDEDLEFLITLANQAAAAIYMAREFHKREQQLKQQVLELQINIDQVKKEKEVSEILKLDYFQSLQKRAEELRNKNK